MGAQIPDGVFQYKSKSKPTPLSEIEKRILLAACSASTGWHHGMYRGENYVPHLSNYCGTASGRVCPSAAGFGASMLFFTDDEGLYCLDTRDAAPFTQPGQTKDQSLETVLENTRSQIRKLSDNRLKLPPEIPHVEAHNTWVVNHPGTFLLIPVGDLAQHEILGLCYLLQNRTVLTDDIHGCEIPGIEQYADLYDAESSWPLSFYDDLSMNELTAEMSCACYSGALMLQAMGLGGWLFNGLNPYSVLGAAEDADVPGLGFRYDTDDRWALPNPTGLEGVMEGFCPPHYADMQAAVDAVCERKFGPGGPYHPDTPGPWKDSRKVRSAAKVHDRRFRECVTLQAQYLYDRFGKFPATVPSIYTMVYLQACHLDLGFYDHFYQPGAGYLDTHKNHFANWHPQS